MSYDADGQTSSANLQSRQIDEIIPREIARPRSIDEISSTLQNANTEKNAVSPWGSGTQVQLGEKLEALDIVLETSALNKVIEYEPGDLTITVQAGMKLSELQNHLSKRGQYLPLDPPYGTKSTIGGIIAKNSSGPKLIVNGLLRDLLLGLRFVLPNGIIAKTGGKVVKNVSGYDMKKLFIGSLGTLCAIAEASLKVLPLPEQKKSLITSFHNTDNALKAALKLTNSEMLPEVVELVAPNFRELSHCHEIPDKNVSLIVSFSGLSEDVERQIIQFEDFCKKSECIGVSELQGKAQSQALEAVQEFPALTVEGLSALAKSTGLVSKLPEIMKTIDATAQEFGLQYSYSAHACTGLVHTWFFSDKQHEATKESLTRALERLRDFLHKLEGTMSVVSCPFWLKSKLPTLDI
ncbi:MAG: FAD-binding oxidoreductase [Candidatus Bathyarchaeia archaeon]